MKDRIQLRSALLALGFTRATFNQADENNEYTEVWTNGPDLVTVSWGGAAKLPIGREFRTDADILKG